jgi:RNA polymerase sigma-70 factor (ECF subfamily)
MSPTDSFQQLFEQLRRRDNAAAIEVVDRYAERLIALARSRLDRRLRQRLDPEDVIQSVFRTFFVRLANGQVVLRDWDSLWGLLVCITVRKCLMAHRHHHAAVRDINREDAPASWQRAGNWAFLDRAPDSSECLLLEETLEQVLQGLKPQEGEMVVLSLQGQTPLEVARKVGYSASKVYRVLEYVRNRLEQLRNAESL